MKNTSWVAVCVLAGSALSCAALAQSNSSVNAGAATATVPAPPSITMAQAMDAAWRRSVAAVESTGQQRRALADQEVAQSWLAGSPALSASQREGRGTATNGARETEISVALPLWRPGQRQRSGAAAQAYEEWAKANELTAKLRLAGQLRETASLLWMAQAEARQASEQRRLLADLAADVKRRVAAGDLARSDAMAARAELLAQQAQEANFQQTLQTQTAAWHVLTGLGSPPAPEDQPRPSDVQLALGQHPEWLQSEAAVHLTQARLALVESQRGAAPELGLGARQDRPSGGQSAQNSLTVSLRIPFSTRTHSQPQVAMALTEHEVALAEQQRKRLGLASELALARSAVERQQALMDTEHERASLLSERASLLRISFQAGETALAELLRAISAGAQAQASVSRQQATLFQARARLQQALGQLP